MQELIKVNVNENQEPIVSARELHNVLGSKERFSKWFDKMIEYGFEENVDYTPYQMVHPQNKQEMTDYAIKLDMAKELAMVSKLQKGKEVRKYFIQIEKDFNSPEKILARALLIANKQIGTLQAQIEEQKPLVEFAEVVANSSDHIDMNEMAKLCNKENVTINGKTIGRNKLFAYLRENEILMENNLPYQRYIDSKWFSVVETTKRTPYGDKIFSKILVTGKGQIKIVEKIRSEQNKDN